jgi:glycosyltransferase involved in cell wall biosynthesis
MGRGDTYKGIETTLVAFARVWRARPASALVVVGEGEDRPRLMSVARDLGIGEQVRFTGAISDDELRRLYERCAFFVLPSKKEGFGLVYLEAMAAGKAVLAARATAVPEIVIDRESGELVPYDDVEALQESMARLFADPELAASYGARGLRQVESEFSFERYRAAIARALEEGLGV